LLPDIVHVDITGLEEDRCHNDVAFGVCLIVQPKIYQQRTSLIHWQQSKVGGIVDKVVGIGEVQVIAILDLWVNPSIADGGSLQVDEFTESSILVASDDPRADSWNIMPAIGLAHDVKDMFAY